MFRTVLKLSENLFQWLSHQVGKKVDTTSVGHTNYDTFNTEISSVINQCFHSRNDDFSSVASKPLRRLFDLFVMCSTSCRRIFVASIPQAWLPK